MKKRTLSLAISLLMCAPAGLTFAQDDGLQERKPPQKGKGQGDKGKGKGQGQKGKGPQRPKMPPFTPQKPFETRGLLPYEDAVLRAAERGIYFLLQEQRDDGAWDVTLTGEFLSKTADQAVDAVAITSLCGQALRHNVHVDPDRINPALQKASRFIIDRLRRGKLSTKVQYAIWRYTLGLRFLTLEYNSSEDETYREEVKRTIQFIVSQLQEMQLTTRKKDNDDGTAMPAPLGIKVRTIDSEGLSSAEITEVTPGLTGASAGLRVGDRIHRIGTTPISSHYDFYRVEPGYMSGDVLEILVERDGDSRTVAATVQPVWPGSLDIKVKELDEDEETDGALVEAVAPGGTAHKAGLKKGDILIKVDDAMIATPKELRQAEDDLRFNEDVTLTFSRRGKERTKTVKATPRFPGNLGMIPNVEDKTGLDGIVVAKLLPKGAARQAGLKKGDRITHIDGIPLQGIDHFIALSETQWARQKIELRVLRSKQADKKEARGKKEEAGKDDPKKGKRRKKKGNGRTEIVDSDVSGEDDNGTEEVVLEAVLKPKPTPPYFGISMSRQHPKPTVGQIHKGDPAEKAGVKVGDRLDALNGVPTPSPQHFLRELMKCRPGQTVKVKITRKGKSQVVEVTLAKKRPGPVIQEKGGAGGWNYYHMGVSTSFVTAATLINLIDANEIDGVDVPRQMLDDAVKAIESMRVVDKAHGDLESYAYSGSTIPRDTDVRGHMGKIACCELALVRATAAGLIPEKRARSNGHLETALRTWLTFRDELDRVRDYKLTHFQGLWNNAAYYWLYGHYYSSLAADWLADNGGEDARVINEVRETTLKALMLKQKPHQGTWYGHHAFGPVAGTARALATLGVLGSTIENQVRGVHPDLARVADHVQNDRYRIAWEDLQAHQDSESDDERYTADIDYLRTLLEQRSERVLEEFTRDWEYDPVISISNAESFLKSFKGLPKAEEFRPTLEQWKSSDGLKSFRKSVKELADLKKKILAGGAFMKWKKAEGFVDEIKKIEETQKGTRTGDEAVKLREALVASYEKGFLGVNMSPQYQGAGAMIAMIVPNSPAAIAGLAPGDVVLKVDGDPVKGQKGLPKLFKGYKPGDGAVLTVLKKGTKQPKMVMVVLGRRFAAP